MESSMIDVSQKLFELISDQIALRQTTQKKKKQETEWNMRDRPKTYLSIWAGP